MEQDQIEVVLAYTSYDYHGEIVSGELPLKEFEEIGPDDYPEYVKLGRWQSGGELIVRPYLRAKRAEDSCMADIAVKISRALAETVEKVTVEPEGYRYQKHEEADFTYFIPPRGWKKNRYHKIAGTIEGHYVKIGHETIKISFYDGRPETMLLRSEIAKEQKDFYMNMILDLISLDRKLCTDDNSPATSLSVVLDDSLYKNTKQMVDDFYEAYQAVEKKAMPGLKAYKEKKPFHKVKKLSPQVLVEHEVLHRNKVSAVSYKEDFDIYEHRVIKTHLHRLKNLIEVRRKIEQIELNREYSRLKYSLKDVSDLIEDCLGEDRLKEKIVRFEDQINKERQRIKNLIERPNLVHPDLEEVYVEFKILDAEKFNTDDINKNDAPYILINKDILKRQGMADGCQYQTYENGQASAPKDYAENGKKTQFITIKIFINCKDAAAKIYHTLYSENRTIEKNDIIGIHGFVDKRYKKGPNERGYAVYEFEFYEITEIKRNDRLIVRKSDSYIQEYMDFMLNRDLKGAEENYGFYQEAYELREKLAKISQKQRDMEKQSKNWALLSQKLAGIENSELMRKVRNERAFARTTNLFAFHPEYQKMYSVINSENKQMESIEYYSDYNSSDLQIAKLSHLYEVWSCIKIVQIFVSDYGFEIQGISSVKDDTGKRSLRKYIQHVLTAGTVSGTRFDLKGIVGGADMKVSIWYDQKIGINRKKLKDDMIFADSRGRASLQPDILLRIHYQGECKFFVMDAKNKEFEHDEVQDICETAFQKYALELGYGMEVNDEFGNSDHAVPYIDGSFILQPWSKEEYKIIILEKEEEVKVSYSPQMYLGAYPDQLVEKVWREKIEKSKERGKRADSRKGSWKVNSERLYRWVKTECGDEMIQSDFESNRNGLHENRIGIIALRPDDLDNIHFLIRMIMEKHFGLYKEKCWMCGHDYQGSEVKEKSTAGGYPKFHIKCKRCGAFTVETHCKNAKYGAHGNAKLGKHIINYYAQWNGADKDSRWNVSCPVCRELASRNDLAWFTADRQNEYMPADKLPAPDMPYGYLPQEEQPYMDMQSVYELYEN